jgi:hypothetical protein
MARRETKKTRAALDPSLFWFNPRVAWNLARIKITLQFDGREVNTIFF